MVAGILLLRFTLSPEAEDALAYRIRGLGISILIEAENAIILPIILSKFFRTLLVCSAT